MCDVVCVILRLAVSSATADIRFTGRMLLLTPSQQCQSTEDKFSRRTSERKNLMENRPLTQVHAEKGREEGGQYNEPDDVVSLSVA